MAAIVAHPRISRAVRARPPGYKYLRALLLLHQVLGKLEERAGVRLVTRVRRQITTAPVLSDLRPHRGSKGRSGGVA
jgi:hypothetical protein